MVHTVVISESHANAIIEGRKNFIVHENSKGFNAGDKISFIVINSSSGRPNNGHPLDGLEAKITYVDSGGGIKEGYVVFGIQDLCKIKLKDDYDVKFRLDDGVLPIVRRNNNAT